MDEAVKIGSSKEPTELIKKYPSLKEGYLEFSFTLPICLHLPNGDEFELYIPERKFPFIIVSEEVIRETSAYGKGKGVEIISDVEGGFRLTQLSIVFKDENPKIPREKLRDVYERDVIRATNRFLDVCRYITCRYPIQSIPDLDSVRNLGVTRYDEKGKGKFVINITFGTEGYLAPHQPLLGEIKIKEIREFSKKFDSIPLEDLFLMDVKRHYFMGRDLEALIGGTTALEIVVSRKEVYVGYSLKERFLRLFTKNLYRGLLKRKTEKLLLKNPKTPKNLLGFVKAAIRERDAVVHNGRKSLKGNIKKHIDSIEKAIKYIKELP